MPKLDGTHLTERIQKRLRDLQAGQEVSKRDIDTLLSIPQVDVMNAAWTEQQELRKNKRPKDKQEQIALGWKEKREIYIEAYKAALNSAQDEEIEAWKIKQTDAEVRRAKIYLSGYFQARDDGKTEHVARNIANNDLTRAGLNREDALLVIVENAKKRFKR